MQRIALIAAALALAACSARSPWAGGSAKAPVATPESAPVAAAAQPAEEGAPAAEGAAPAASGKKYSWQANKEAAEAATTKVETGAPADDTKARIVALRLSDGLLAFIRKEKPEDGAFLQLTKENKALLVRVIRSDDTMTTADIVAGQDPAKIPALEVGDEVVCGTPSDLPPQ